MQCGCALPGKNRLGSGERSGASVASMPRLTPLRGVDRSNEIAAKGKAMYREPLVKDWVKPGGASGPKQTHGGG